MNYQRILRITSGYLLFTGYQIRSLDVKNQRYRLSLWSVIYFLCILVIYLISFEHHFEESALLKITLDLSPFLKNLLIFQIWLGLKTFIFCLIEWKFLTKVFNGLAEILIWGSGGGPKGVTHKKDLQYELLTYMIFFATFIVAFGFGLYIAIEMKFELPPIDHIMIALALFVPHFMIAGCLRLHTLTLWLVQRKLFEYKQQLKENSETSDLKVIIEIINPVLKQDLDEAVSSKENVMSGERNDKVVKHNLEENNTAMEDGIPANIYKNISEGVTAIARYLCSTNKILQRQLLVLNGLNYNCLLYGIFTRLYFEKIWYPIFIGRNRRVFYAANSVIFVCIILDYFLLALTLCGFKKMKSEFYKEVNKQLKATKSSSEEKVAMLRDITFVLKNQMNLKLFNVIDFKIWNFVLIQLLMLLSILITVFYQYFNDQILALTQLVESSDDE
ncbi:gustatory receptor-like 40a [Musca autumnalis]|uniref:gustatory receptor-like 40a n=1 Tax=Musca autumnalis TaxID=221902 RepID=UPI003CEC9AD9